MDGTFLPPGHIVLVCPQMFPSNKKSSLRVLVVLAGFRDSARACHHYKYNQKNIKDKMRNKDGDLMTKYRKIADDH